MLRTPCFLFSDVHLGAAPRDIEQPLLSFLRFASTSAESIVINGDLFDFWFEWKSVIPRVGFRVLAALADARDAGVEIIWVAGNHDCWGGDVIERDVGITYVMGPWRGTIGKWRAEIDHGDGLRDVEDRRYRALRSVLRHPLSIRAFRWIHPDWSSRLALGSSTASRVHRARDGGAGLQSVAVARLVSDPTLDLLVLGHSHVHALVRAANGGVYANPGSWLDAPTYLRIDDDRIELMQWTGSAEGDRLDSLNRRTEESLAQS